MYKKLRSDFPLHAPCAILFALICILLLINISCQRNTDAGLVAYYPFNGNASDESGYGNSGIVHGARLTTDRFGKKDSAYYFDGTSAYILAKVSDMPAVDSAQTISWWYMIQQPPTYPDSLGADNMIALVDTAADIGVQTGYRAPGYHTRGLDTWYWGGGTVLESTPPAVNRWHHCAYTYDGKTHRFYLDGQQVAQSSVKPQSGTPDMLMFGNYPSGDQFFAGSLDDIRIYKRPLAQSEIDKLYKAKE